MRQRKLRNGLVHWCRTIEITCKPADAPDHIADASVDPVVIDPPYYANIMYAELSDFLAEAHGGLRLPAVVPPPAHRSRTRRLPTSRDPSSRRDQTRRNSELHRRARSGAMETEIKTFTSWHHIKLVKEAAPRMDRERRIGSARCSPVFSYLRHWL
jgi:hypothetical protein